MPGTFGYPFEDDEATGFFGGYRRPQPALDDPNVVPVSDAMPTEADAAGDTLSYPNGKQVVDPFGHPYQQPSTFDLQKNLAIAQTMRDASEYSDPNVGQENVSLMFAPHFIAGASMDYKRPDGLLGPYERQYRPISYYNYGVMAAKVGYGREEALRNAGLYNRIFGGPARNRYGLDGDDAEEFIKQGFNDYTNGSWTAEPAD